MIPETYFSVHEELCLLGMTFLLGAALGVCYEVLRAVRVIFPHGQLLIAAEDILFLGFCGIAVTAFASAAARGEMRFYYFIGCIAGAGVYFATAGSIFHRALCRMISLIRRVFLGVMSPLKSVYVLFRKKAAAKFVGYSKVIVNSIKKIDFLLLRRVRLMYNKRTNKKRKNVKNVGKKSKKNQKKAL